MNQSTTTHIVADEGCLLRSSTLSFAYAQSLSRASARVESGAV